MDITFDLETAPTNHPLIIERIQNSVTHPSNMSKPDTIAKWEEEKRPGEIAKAYNDTALNLMFAQITCVSWAFDDGEPQVIVTKKDSQVMTELQLLKDFFAAFDDIPIDSPVNWIGHNIRQFDLLLLRFRAMYHNLELPRCYPTSLRRDHGISDTLEMMTLGIPRNWLGTKGGFSLDIGNCCLLLGVIHDTPHDGSECPDLWATDQLDELKAKCIADVKAERELYWRLKGKPRYGYEGENVGLEFAEASE